MCHCRVQIQWRIFLCAISCSITPFNKAELSIVPTRYNNVTETKLQSCLPFIYPCIASISLKYNQQYATFSRSIYFYKLLYIFQAVPPPTIRNTILYIQRQVLSNQYCCMLLSWMRWSVVPSHPR